MSHLGPKAILSIALLPFALIAQTPLQLRAADKSELYEVGVARVDITPDYPIRLNGFGGRRTESEGVRQRIWAKAIAIGNDEQNPAILLTIDSLGIRMPMVDEVARRLRQQAGIKRDHVALTFSHSHTTPKVNGAADTIFSVPIPADHQKHIDRYTAELTDHLTAAALAALKNRKPSRLQWSVGKVGFAINRRTAGGPVDHDLPMLVVRAPDNSVRAIYVSYACHCVTLSDNLISGDWAGFAQQAIERRFPGAIALVSIGAGSDSNPSSGVTGGKGDVAARQGAEIADEVFRLMSRPLRAVKGRLSTTLKRIDLPLKDLPNKQQLEAVAAKGGPAGYNASYQLQRLASGRKLVASLEYPIQTWSFGDSLSMVFLAGEVCVDYSSRLKKELNRDHLWINAYANDFCAYIPSERLLKEGGYGGGAEVVYFALPTTLKPGLEKKIIDEVRRQVPKSHHVAPGTAGVPPKSPEQSLQTLSTHAGLNVELVASEPQVQDPVAIDFGLDGKLWVAEMADYAQPVEGEFSHSGRIKFLEDIDADGLFEKATLFADGFRFPTEVKAWRDGVLVCDAPDILFLVDEDGDGKADRREVYYSGFATHNPHARVNSLRLGLDNWLYGSCGLFGGTITSHSGQKLALGGRDFRLRPDQGLIEPVTGTTQQGRCRNDWGDWFGCNNGTLIQHYPVFDRYARRNPFIAPPATAVFVPDYDDPNQLFPAGELVRFKLSGPAGRPTSACGLGIYRDSLMGEQYYGNSFTCEPVNQLVHRLQLRQSGSLIRGRRAASETSSEFLSSTDQWFRPVQARTGPDGGLWIVDMYRYVIEHPKWIPESTRSQLNVFAGQKYGRIFRVIPDGVRRRDWSGLAELSPADLATRLDSANGTLRDMVHQRLLESEAKLDAKAVAELQRIASEGQHPAARGQALAVLDGISELPREVIAEALTDKHDGVRRQAVRLAEQQISQSAGLQKELLGLVHDVDPTVRLQLAYSLGEMKSDGVPAALIRLYTSPDADAYQRAAVLSSVHRDNLDSLVDAVLAMQKKNRLTAELLDSLHVMVARVGTQRQRSRMVMRLGSDESLRTPAGWIRLAQMLEELAKTSGDLDELLDENELARIGNIQQRAVALVTDPKIVEAGKSITLKVAALGVIGDSASRDSKSSSDLLLDLISPSVPLELQQAAIRAIRKGINATSATSLIERMSSSSPVVRSEIVSAMLSREASTLRLLEACEKQTIAASAIDLPSRNLLKAHNNEKIRGKAEELFATATGGARQQIIEKYLKSVSTLAKERPANATAGRAIFTKHCGSCHQLSGVGEKVGPDLAALTNRSPRMLLTAIVDPNREIDARYLNYVARSIDGRTVAGMIAEETTTSITLRGQDDKSTVLLRNELEEFRDTGTSYMPEGIEKQIAEPEMGDLLAFVHQAASPAKQFAGNTPARIEQSETGQLALLASQCKIHGGSILFEAPFKNIGFWHHANDHVIWEIEVAKQGRFDIYLDYACHDASAGNQLAIHGLEIPLRYQVQATGGWDKYVRTRIGETDLKAGRRSLIVQPSETVRGALCDLKAIYLVPVGKKPSFVD